MGSAKNTKSHQMNSLLNIAIEYTSFLEKLGGLLHQTETFASQTKTCIAPNIICHCYNISERAGTFERSKSRI